MSKIFDKDYIEKVIMLERMIGSRVNYNILDPFSLDIGDIREIQAAAKKIACHVGLNDFTFLITICQQKEEVSGNIELSQNPNVVFIELSDDILKSNDAILATLAHEIAHKYLYVNNITCGKGITHKYENEVLTDITAVFLGLGKLMLNGCESVNVRQERDLISRKTITETLKVGYLNHYQLAFVYSLVCNMRKISSQVYEKGLLAKSIQELCDYKINYSHYFNSQFHEENIKTNLITRLNTSISEIQLILSKIDRSLLYIRKACIGEAETFLEKTHFELNDLTLKSRELNAEIECDPCLKYLNMRKLNQTIEYLTSKMNKNSIEANIYKNGVTETANFVQTLGDPFPEPDLNMFNIIVCRNDGTRLKLPQDKSRLLAKCPKCKYKFLADTTLLPLKKNNNIRKDSLLKRIIKKFK